MKEGLEIERKFLLKHVPLAYQHTNGLAIVQYYVNDQGGRFRVRETYAGPHQVSYDKTYKEEIRSGVYQEKVIDIDYETFRVFANKAHLTISKMRIHAPHTSDGLKWEIDVFSLPTRLVIAEIEMPTEDYALIIPDFIKEALIMEVTPFKEFTNYALANTFTPWP